MGDQPDVSSTLLEGNMDSHKGGYDVGQANAEVNVDRMPQMEIDEGGDENKERGNWGGQLDFLLSALGYAVGLGNVWRFPYLCYQSGGGAFLIPYAIMLVFVGMPIFFFELSLGQYTSQGPMGAFGYAPFFQGIGMTMVIISAMVCIYYNMIIAWSIHYLFSSFTSVLPWSHCNNEWNTPLCFDRVPDTDCNMSAVVNQCWESDTDNTLSATVTGYASYETRGLCYSQQWNVTYEPTTATGVAFDGCNSTTESMLGGLGIGNITEDLSNCIWHFVNNSTMYGDPMESSLGDYNYTCANVTESLYGITNNTLAKEHGVDRQYPSLEYLERRVLRKSDSIGDLGETQWELVLCLIAAWVIVYLSLINGVKSSGKVVYFTALFPYLVLIILFFNGILLPGAGKGVEFYIYPVWERLADAKVWKDATSQIFFSLSASWGGLITLASYNRFNNNVLRDTLIVTLGNCLTSFFAGFVIFSYLGNMAQTLGVEPGDVADQGSTLAFVVYPHAVLSIPGSVFWSIIFFIMLITLGLDSQFTLLETVVTSIYDRMPQLRRYKYIVLGVMCVIMFLLGLPLCTQAGEHILTLIDSTAGGWNIMIIGILETTSIALIYGWHNFAEDIHLMIGQRPTPWWRANWTIVTPVILVAVLIFSWYEYSGFSNGSYQFPEWANAIGWIITLATLVPIVVYMILTVVRSSGSGIIEKFTNALHYNERWGPALTKHRALVTHLHPFKVDVSGGTDYTASGDGWSQNPSSTQAFAAKGAA